MSSSVKKRSDIPVEHTWDLEKMFANTEAWEQAYKKVQDLIPKVTVFQGKLGESADTLLAALQVQDELEAAFENVYVFANMRSHQDLSNTTYQGMVDRATGLAAQAMGASSFFRPEVIALPKEKIESFLAENEGLKQYQILLERLMREKDHVLSPVEENLIARMAEVAEAPATIYSRFANADLKFPQAEDSKGELHDVTEGQYRVLMEAEDRTLRKNGFKKLFGTYGNYKSTFGATLTSSMKKDAFIASTRKYDSTLEMALSPDNMPTEVYDNLIQAVRDNMDTMHRYVSLRKKVLGLDELHYYDLFIPMVDEVKQEMPYEKAQGIILDALTPLGEEYVTTVQRAFDERWIDIYPNEGKRSGAYSWGTYESLPFILLNYTNTQDDMFTLAHELGHSLHSYFTNKTQPVTYGNYTIFVAEVASTLN
ncbi:MAG TPA: M3 family oligoendopeptidase, partial [Bacilli bacterium]|nr:M3 family oligoendopeptidase [Bacilli bacterium]